MFRWRKKSYLKKLPEKNDDKSTLKSFYLAIDTVNTTAVAVKCLKMSETVCIRLIVAHRAAKLAAKREAAMLQEGAPVENGEEEGDDAEAEVTTQAIRNPTKRIAAAPAPAAVSSTSTSSSSSRPTADDSDKKIIKKKKRQSSGSPGGDLTPATFISEAATSSAAASSNPTIDESGDFHIEEDANDYMSSDAPIAAATSAPPGGVRPPLPAASQQQGHRSKSSSSAGECPQCVIWD